MTHYPQRAHLPLTRLMVLGVTDVWRAAEFWSAALGYSVREDGFGGWAKVLVPPNGLEWRWHFN